MKFGMIVNPKAGPTNTHRKVQLLHAVQDVLGDCEIRGLETTVPRGVHAVRRRVWLGRSRS